MHDTSAGAGAGAGAVVLAQLGGRRCLCERESLRRVGGGGRRAVLLPPGKYGNWSGLTLGVGSVL